MLSGILAGVLSVSLPPALCSTPLSAQILPPVTSAPDGVTGQVAFYAEHFDPRTGRTLEIIARNPDRRVTLGSAYKALVAWQTFRDVDVGRAQLNDTLTAATDTRSIGAYFRGPQTISTLLLASIRNSQNTAADLLQTRAGLAQVASVARELSPCNDVFLTTRAYWGAQAGLLPTLFPDDTREAGLARAGQYFALPFDQKVRRASAIVSAARSVRPDSLEASLDRWLTGPAADERIDVYLQNSSTPAAWAQTLKRLYSGADLTPASNTAYRALMTNGCCKPNPDPLRERYWGLKGGSGWRFLVQSGYVERADGTADVYVYSNSGSTVKSAAGMEAQRPAVARWVARNLQALSRKPLTPQR